MFPAAYANTFCFQRKLFVSFPTFCREKNVEMMFKLVAGAIQQAEGQDVGGLLHLLHIHLCQPLHPPDDRYSRVSLATRMDLSVHPTITGVYYLKKFPSTSSYFDRIIPLYPPDDHFSRVSLATGINQTWSMRPSKEWLVSSTSKSSPYFWVKMEQFVCESSLLVKGGLLPMHSLACFDRIITLGQKFQKVENDENRFFAITSSKLFKNWFCKGHIFSNNIFHNHCFLYVL